MKNITFFPAFRINFDKCFLNLIGNPENHIVFKIAVSVQFSAIACHFVINMYKCGLLLCLYMVFQHYK